MLEFLTRGATQVTETATQLYLIVLAIIIGDKEVARWHASRPVTDPAAGNGRAARAAAPARQGRRRVSR